MNTNQNAKLVTVIYNGEEIEVTSEIADSLEEFRLEERRQNEKIRRHCSDKDFVIIEDFMFDKPHGFEDELIDRLTVEKFPEVLATLPEIQRRRITATTLRG
ncbi:hypothetical protein FACS189499_04010 [Clostridia bacterium]|nr:hypothetical protein FACS189499_04010 [Clostridia bacterium]